jgi:hypothetical protein
VDEGKGSKTVITWSVLDVVVISTASVATTSCPVLEETIATTADRVVSLGTIRRWRGSSFCAEARIMQKHSRSLKVSYFALKMGLDLPPKERHKSS